MEWKETVTSVSEKVFPGISHKIDDKFMIENEVMSNLALQMALYFNVILSPIWLFIMLMFMGERYSCYDVLYKFIIFTILITIVIAETLRLYLGYEGNLRDKVPELAGFWMLSVFLQFPLQGLLLFNPYFNLTTIEVVVQAVMFLLLCSQLIFGYRALKYTATKQAIYFKITKLRKDVISYKYKVNNYSPF